MVDHEDREFADLIRQYPNPAAHEPPSQLELKMGVRNYLIEGVSGTGKTSVCDELQGRERGRMSGWLGERPMRFE